MVKDEAAATLLEVARRAGVSKSTVSRVINDSSAVSQSARESVERAIAELGYVPNRAARSLATRRARAVALVIPEDTRRFFGDPFFAAVVQGIDKYLTDTDLVLNLLIASTGDRQKTLNYLTGGNADGALVLSHHTSDQFVRLLEERLPVVYGGRPIEGTPTKTYVDVDNYSGAKVATEFLFSQGATRVASLSGPSSMPSGRDRLAGYVDVVTAHGKPALFEEGDYTISGGERAMQRLLERGEIPDALFVASDLMARGAIPVLERRGIRVPDDVRIVGFDDSPVATQSTPTLTTMRQPSEEQGRLMAKMLVELLDGDKEVGPVILETELVIRESAPVSK